MKAVESKGATNKGARTPNKIIDPDFAKRLNKACEMNPNVPTEGIRGRQKWLYDHLEREHKIVVSPEAVRKWFAGESRPRPLIMSAVAQSLEVDLSWLSLGTTPDHPSQERAARNAQVDGVVNIVAGLLRMAGNSVAFPDEHESGVHLYSIVKGTQHAINVSLAYGNKLGVINFIVPRDFERKTVIGVFEHAPMAFTLLRLTGEIIEAQNDNRADFVQLSIRHEGDLFYAGTMPVPIITNLTDLSGEIRRKK